VEGVSQGNPTPNPNPNPNPIPTQPQRRACTQTNYPPIEKIQSKKPDKNKRHSERFGFRIVAVKVARPLRFAEINVRHILLSKSTINRI